MNIIHMPEIVGTDEDGYPIVRCPLSGGRHSYGETGAEGMVNIREHIVTCPGGSGPEEGTNDPGCPGSGGW